MTFYRRNLFVANGVWLLVFPVLTAMLVALPAFAEDESKPATFDYQEAIGDLRIDELQMHLRWLADDAQEGRCAGTEAGRRVGDYLVTQLTLLGLEPAGTDDSYLQGFRFNDGEARYRNVLGIIRGSDPDLAGEYVMICAHYDHVGVIDGEVYPGANDNASGTSMILELAESLEKIEPRPKRSVIVAFWDAEEKGLLGSRHFANNPMVPLSQVKIVVNFDMVGTLQNNSFEIFGSNAATGVRETVARLMEPDDPDIDFSTEYLLASDHSSFYAKKIPALMFFTGLDCPYHTPEDKFGIINFDGMKQIADIAFRFVFYLADANDLSQIQYISPRDMRRNNEKSGEAFGFWVTDTMGLTIEDDQEPEGTQPDDSGRSLGKLLGNLFGDTAEKPGGLRVSKVAKDSCAEQLGLQRGDRVMTLNGRDADNLDDFDEAITALLVEEPERVMFLRVARPRESEEWLRFEINPADLTVANEMIRQGFLYWESLAEPDTLIVGDVSEDRANEQGLQTGDRIMRINGNRASGETLRDALKTKRPLSLEIERNGKVSQLELAL
ncbi:MAG: M28 family peptidase [Planctomycetaceae bacterium]|nr:M28 family peptidase [Planctomycetaceae bacterium]